MTEWWAALTTFERRTAESDILPSWAQGACGWLAVMAANEDDARQTIARDLAAVNLRLLEMDQARLIDDREAASLDARLAENLRTQRGASTVWGTIHCYAADGEV